MPSCFRLAAILVLLAGVAAGCQDADSALPDPVAKTRSEILGAAENGDYGRLGTLIDRSLFLSDADFADPIAYWRQLGQRPLRTMDVLLRMPHQVRETNEGTLYQWPRFGPDSKPEDVSDSERELLREVFTEAQLRSLILPEYGYVSPRLGILEDGRWWFFILESGP